MNTEMLEMNEVAGGASDLEALKRELQAFESQGSGDEPAGTNWRLVVDTSNDAFIAADASGVLIEWNKKAEELFGWTSEQAIGRTLEETVFPPDPARGDRGGLQKIIAAQKEGKRLEMDVRRSDGVDVPAEVSVSTMRRGSSFVFNAFVHDISNRRELQMQLAHAQKLESIGQLSAGIAHEINTPAQYVGDNTQFLKESVEDLMHVLEKHRALADAVRNGDDPKPALEAADAAAKEADLDYLTEELGSAIDQSLDGIARVSRIVRAMKEFSHPGVAAKTPTDLNAAIANTITVATNEWKYVATIETDFDESLPQVPCLPGDFNQVILNLIVNSAHAIRDVLGKHSTEKGLITISTRHLPPDTVGGGSEGANQGEVEIVVNDTGCGIPDEIVNRVFDPFFTTKDVGVGTGQGLAIARNVIVDKHGGVIDVVSQPGKGSTFTIRLPLDV